MNNLISWTDMHIHPSSPNSSISEENAATKIQAGFRGYRVRKQLKDDIIDDNGVVVIVDADCKKKVNQVGAAAEQNKSATKIQASVRGFLVRKKQKTATDAATKIQASFRGFKARQEFKKLKDK